MAKSLKEMDDFELGLTKKQLQTLHARLQSSHESLSEQAAEVVSIGEELDEVSDNFYAQELWDVAEEIERAYNGMKSTLVMLLDEISILDDDDGRY